MLKSVLTSPPITFMRKSPHDAIERLRGKGENFTPPRRDETGGVSRGVSRGVSGGTSEGLDEGMGEGIKALDDYIQKNQGFILLRCRRH